MSFWKSLFGGGGAGGGAAKVAKREEYNGYTIEAAPYPADGQYQVAGVISKDVAGERREHKFVRADRFASLEDATDFSVVKAKQIIDQNGERMFS